MTCRNWSFKPGNVTKMEDRQFDLVTATKHRKGNWRNQKMRKRTLGCILWREKRQSRNPVKGFIVEVTDLFRFGSEYLFGQHLSFLELNKELCLIFLKSDCLVGTQETQGGKLNMLFLAEEDNLKFVTVKSGN